MRTIILYCRAGFEGECSREISTCSKKYGAGNIVAATPGSGYAVFRFANDSSAGEFIKSFSFSSMMFARQMMAASDAAGPLSPGNRVAPIVEIVKGTGLKYSGFFIETADTNDAKQLSGLCRKLDLPFSEALRKEGLLVTDSVETGAGPLRLHVFFTATDHAYAGYSYGNNSSPWRMGIPRLKFPAGAPSRSTLKLEEAFYVFLRENELDRLLKPGVSAVDLGASPGGWTWQFVTRGMRVTAVDNGNMDRQLLGSGLVRHVRGDGFTFAPKQPVEWMVCDIVEQPSRIAKLCARWVAAQWCRRTVFNLKLPMKKKYDEIERCREIIDLEMKKNGVRYNLRIKQLYHDREEVTGYLKRV
jgi:23S rRNA (cytidine2498-2'-O)-methyltransferase